METNAQRPWGVMGPSENVLKVGVVFDATFLPQWVFRTIKAILDSGINLDVYCYRFIEREESGTPTLPTSKSLLAWIYEKLDGWIFPLLWDEMEKVSMTALLPSGGMEEIVFGVSGPKKDAPRARAPDFAIVFGDEPELPKWVGDHLGCPIWRFGTDGNEEFCSRTAGFREVRKDIPTTVLSLIEERVGQSPRQIATAVCPTHRYSPWKNRNNVLEHAPSLVAQGLRWRACSLLPVKASGVVSPTEEEIGRVPFPLTRIIKKQIHRLAHRDQWMIGYRQRESFRPDGGMDHFRVATPPRDRYWADPFPVSVRNRHFIFFEEYLFKKQKAHISCVELGPLGEWQNPRTVLERDYHLSYPHLFQFEGNWYMLPETGVNRTIEVYRCHSFPWEWRLEKIMMENIVAADSTLRYIDGMWWMFTSLGSIDQSQFNELWIFHSDHPLGGWRSHPLNPVLIDARFARGAGNLFEWEGVLHRPAQNCSRSYGGNIQVRRIRELSPRSFREEDAFPIFPTWTKNIDRVHTLNWSEGLAVLDGFCWSRRGK